MQPNRITKDEYGQSIDRTKLLTFTFDGQKLTGFAGDTVASALLANNVHLIARSIKYHRPRGILSCGVEEPTALIECARPGHKAFPNHKATEVMLSEGLIVKSQNNWPSRNFDAIAALSFGSRLLQAGFYYKTFKWPLWGWPKLYEKVIRKFAGSGRIRFDESADPNESVAMDQRNKFCQILIIGGGPAGLNAALECALQGLRVVIIEQDSEFGGSLLWNKASIDRMSTDSWLANTLDALHQCSNLTMLPNTLAFGHYDHGMLLAYQSFGLDEPGVLWKIRAERILLASGAIERPLVFSNNDRPGIMLASAVRAYLHRYAVRPGHRAVLAITDEKQRQATELELADAGITIAATVNPGEQLIDSTGHRRIRSVAIKTKEGKIVHHSCDLVCVSGGWTPTVHLAAHVHGALELNPDSYTPYAPSQQGCMLAMGANRGIFELEAVLADSENQAKEAMSQIGISVKLGKSVEFQSIQESLEFRISNDRCGSAFVDLQNDVTCSDLIQAVSEGYSDIELLKRYTLTGMGTDQGKTSWVNAVNEIAAVSESPATQLRHTSFRPPYSPVLFAGLAGARTGKFMTPVRKTPLHRVLENLGCVFQHSGDWLYARHFPKQNETMEESVNREVNAVRTSVGFVDMSTLGKFEVKGPGAELFVSRLYCNDVSQMPLGKVRYGLMLREDGIIFDDGTVARLGDEHYLLTATTANADAVWRWITRLAQIQWPNLEVTLTDVSEQWATIAIAGPKSRALLSKFDLSVNTDRLNFPFGTIREGTLPGNQKCRIYAVSYSGEMCFEVNIPAGFGCSFVERLMDVGQEFGITPYGIEALDVLRIEKGHLAVGSEIDGRTTPYDLGLGKMVAKDKDFIGQTLLNRSGLKSEERLQLVGLTAINEKFEIPAGGVVVEQPLSEKSQQRLSGWLTAAVYSPTLKIWVALALLKNGQNRQDDKLWVTSPIAGQSTQVEVCHPCFFDTEGTRLHG